MTEPDNDTCTWRWDAKAGVWQLVSGPGEPQCQCPTEPPAAEGNDKGPVEIETVCPKSDD